MMMTEVGASRACHVDCVLHSSLRRVAAVRRRASPHDPGRAVGGHFKKLHH